MTTAWLRGHGRPRLHGRRGRVRSAARSNDGVDNDGDGLIDLADTGRTGPFDDDESLPGEDDEDNDDGRVDADDPDCDDSDYETDFGDTQCNDGEDNDGDGYIDSTDDLCLDATTDAEALGRDKENGDDDDGWMMTTHCADGEDEVGLSEGDGAPECNDGEDTTAMASRQRRLHCRDGSDMYENNDGCVNGRDDDGDGWTTAVDPERFTHDDESPAARSIRNNLRRTRRRLHDADDPGCDSATICTRRRARDRLQRRHGQRCRLAGRMRSTLTARWWNGGYRRHPGNDGINNDPPDFPSTLRIQTASPRSTTTRPPPATVKTATTMTATAGSTSTTPTATTGAPVGGPGHRGNDGIDNEIDGPADADDLDCAEATDDNDGLLPRTDSMTTATDGSTSTPRLHRGQLRGWLRRPQARRHRQRRQLHPRLHGPGCDNVWDVVEDPLATNAPTAPMRTATAGPTRTIRLSDGGVEIGGFDTLRVQRRHEDTTATVTPRRRRGVLGTVGRRRGTRPRRDLQTTPTTTATAGSTATIRTAP